MLNNVGFASLETERFVLRQLTLQDADEIFVLRSDGETNKLIDRPTATHIRDAIAHINKIINLQERGDGFFWVISSKNQSKLLGTILFYNIDRESDVAEIGYELMPAHQGQGVMYEALQRVLAFGFNTLQLKKVIAEVKSHNTRSVSLLKKFNFYQAPNPGDAKGYVIYSLDNPDLA